MYDETIMLSPNCDPSGAHERRGVLFHHTEMLCEETLRRMADPAFERSYHCVIREDGARFTLVCDEDIAWHAGRSVFQGRSRCNDFLLGVSFAGDTAAAPLGAAQIESALGWLAPRWERYRWTLDVMTDHRQVSPGRKRDLHPPEWERLRGAIASLDPSRFR